MICTVVKPSTFVEFVERLQRETGIEMKALNLPKIKRKRLLGWNEIFQEGALVKKEFEGKHAKDVVSNNAFVEYIRRSCPSVKE